MKLDKLFILELEAYSRLCEKRKADLFRDMKLYSGDSDIRKKYQQIVAIDDMVTKEIDKRIFELEETGKKKDEKNLEND